MTKRIGRRTAIGLIGAAALAKPHLARAADDVEVAMLVPLSGPWAEQGILEKAGAEMAVDDINQAGGIKALGGAKVKLLSLDTGSTAETAKNAAQRMISENPNLAGGFGCWLSTFTLAATEVTERAELPWLTLSYSDAITDRGFKYIFQSAPTANTQAEQIVPYLMKLAQQATGKVPTKVAMIGDNTGASVSFMKPIRDHVLKDQHLEAVVDQVYTPPLADATAMVQPVRGAKPDFVLLLSTNNGDDKILADTFTQYGMPATKLALVGNGGHWVVPELLKTAGKDILQDVMVGLANWPGKAVNELSERYVKRTGNPWFGHNEIFAYAHVQILAWAANKAASADRRKVADAIRAMDITDGPAIYFPGSHLKFDDKGRRVDAQLVIIQWQDGKPVTIFPESMAVSKPVWPT
ncbi:ABC transporter substrate-binding protein [Sphingomonas sp.]|uniref:ABC transporter substrate-binding protein n=1 Tax=Sphingomonas sp. TaxID=28214 RepID=UPI0025D266ED|nr:ABC transporter substrate-binding protein [Sphingomonas sp.]MBV9528307.1 ABC transporter substrate-binding protein [Sphingomonas sp.]